MNDLSTGRAVTASSARHDLATTDRRHSALVTAAIAVAGMVLLGALVIGLGLLVTDVLATGAVGRWDLGVNEWFVAQRTPTLDTLTRYGSDLGATLTIVGVAIVCAVGLAIARRWRLVELLAISLVLEVSIFLLATITVDRPRPDVPRLDVSPPTASYPSGHTAAAIVLYVALAIVVRSITTNRLARAVAWILAIALPVAVALSRLYRGMHHPTDVAGSVVLGVGALLIATLAMRAGSASSGDRERTS